MRRDREPGEQQRRDGGGRDSDAPPRVEGDRREQHDAEVPEEAEPLQQRHVQERDVTNQRLRDFGDGDKGDGHGPDRERSGAAAPRDGNRGDG